VWSCPCFGRRTNAILLQPPSPSTPLIAVVVLSLCVGAASQPNLALAFPKDKLLLVVNFSLNVRVLRIAGEDRQGYGCYFGFPSVILPRVFVPADVQIVLVVANLLILRCMASQELASDTGHVSNFIASCKRSRAEPSAWFRDVLSRIPSRLVHHLHELLPQEWKPLSPPIHRDAVHQPHTFHSTPKRGGKKTVDV